MPYRKSYKKTYRKRRPRMVGGKTKKLVTGQRQPTMIEKIAGGFGAAASVAKAVLPIISAINTENKYNDLIYNATIPIATPTMVPLNLLAQGADENERIGNSILLRDMNMRLSFIPDFTAVDYQLVRYIIFVDKQQQGTAPTAAQLLTTPANIDTPFNRNYSDRFVIIKDKRLVLAKNNLASNTIFQKIYKKLQFHARYIGQNGVPAELGNNALYLFAVSASVGNPPTLYVYNRINFTDN